MGCFSKLCTLETARKSDLHVLQDWLERKRGGDFFLKGYEADTWKESNAEDLVSMIGGQKDEDVLTQWVNVSFIPWFHDVLGQQIKVGNSSIFDSISRLGSEFTYSI